MKKHFLWILLLAICSPFVHAQERTQIKVSTNAIDLVLTVGRNNQLYQTYFGDKLIHEEELQIPNNQDWEVYPGSGSKDYFEPALLIKHNDGNLTTILYYQKHEVNKIDDNITQTVVYLKDNQYPVEVKLFYQSFAKENIIKTWTEISHSEKKPVILSRYASSMLYLSSEKYFVTEFSGDWANETNMQTQELHYGKKVIDTKLGSRAAMLVSPFFQLGLNEPAAEQKTKTLMGTIGWTGNFQFTFEVDNEKNLRVISSINPYASDYELKAKEVFTTPEFIFTYADGTGEASRNFHSWARNYQLKDGKGDRLTLLNNWEATYFNFDQNKLSELMSEAKELGVDMFLLDDGWFANKYPRANDGAGLGDWEVTKTKLPDGIPFLVKAAEKAGVKFGIWIEPEMVNPKSELYEKHPDWVIEQPNRETYYFRNQLVLDLSNPDVQDFVFGVVDKIMKENPNIAFFKWDCNSPITNIYSPYLKEKQSQLYIDHVRGLYNVFKRVKENYPNLPMMLCSGGGGRCDYEALKYFTEFWPSDNTDPIERLYIQWGFSQFFPSKAMCAHVTSWNQNASIKFRVDVASMCKMGFDINYKELNPEEQAYCKTAITNYKRLKPIILDGDLYRLVSPYEGNHSAIMYSNESKDHSVLFAFDIYPRYNEKAQKIKLQGLDPNKRYKIEEINLMGKNKGRNYPTVSGDYLMKIGLDIFSGGKLVSHILEITAE